MGLVTMSEQARRSHSQRKTSVTTAPPAKFLFAGMGYCSASQISLLPRALVSASQTSLLSMVSVSAICAVPVAKTLVSVRVWASVLEQGSAHCDQCRDGRHGARRFQ